MKRRIAYHAGCEAPDSLPAALAAETGVAFWNMFEAMGGEGSMVEMVNHKPQMANYDYTHINFRGGKHIAGLLFETLMYGKEQYEKRKAYEME